MTELVESVPPDTVPLRQDRPTYQYGDLWVGMADSLKVKPDFVWLAYNANGKRVANAATRDRLVQQLDTL